MQLGGIEGGEDGERHAGADALHAGEQAEPVALRLAGKADKANELLADQHLGMDGYGVARPAQSGEAAGRHADQIAHAADVDHGLVETG